MAMPTQERAPADYLRLLVRTIQETRPPPKPLLGYSWIPRFINPPSIELTKSIICGVDCDEVYPGIFVGDEGSARNKEFLNAVGITHVFNTAEGPSFGQVSTGKAYYTGANITYLGLNLMDLPTTRIINHFEHGTNFIESALSANDVTLLSEHLYLCLINCNFAFCGPQLFSSDEAANNAAQTCQLNSDDCILRDTDSNIIGNELVQFTPSILDIDFDDMENPILMDYLNESTDAIMEDASASSSLQTPPSIKAERIESTSSCVFGNSVKTNPNPPTPRGRKTSRGRGKRKSK